MIRHDYILRMIEEFIQSMARIGTLKEKEHWEEAGLTLEEQFQRLVRADATTARILSDTELVARLMEGSSTQLTRHKTFMLATLFNEAGDVALGQDKGTAARAFYLKGLHLLLLTLLERDAGEVPEFVPAIEAFLCTLGDEPLPIQTSALLMQFYEETGQYGRLEDALFALLDLEPDNPDFLALGMAMYRRLQSQNDAALDAGELPRSEVEAGLAELERRRAAIT
jgi:hypothetical protein